MKNFKRAVFAILFIAVTLVLIEAIGLLFGCDIAAGIFKSNEEALLPQNEVNENIENSGYTAVNTIMGYSELSDEEKALYNLISNGITAIGSETDENGRYKIEPIVFEYGALSDFSVGRAVSVFLNENPDVFWVCDTYSYSVSDEKTTVDFLSYVSREKCSEMAAQILSVTDAFAARLTSNLGEYEREKLIFNFLTSKISYGNSENAEEAWMAYTVYGALVNGRAVCEGYSKSLLKLLNMCGIDSVLVCGYLGENNPHMWNLVKIDENWYHIDITGCDDDMVVNYKYFNLNDAYIMKSHTLCGEYDVNDGSMYKNISLPLCASDKYNYIKHDAFKLTKLSGTELADFINEKSKSDENICIYIPESMNFNETISKLFSASPRFYIQSLNKAGMSSAYSGDDKEIAYVFDEKTRSITVKNSLKSS